MALFKVSKGLKANLPSAKTEGYCWYTTDDSLFYIDYKDENGTLQRKALNAKDAETLTGASLSTILNSSDVEIPTSKAVLDALNAKLDKADAGSDWNQNDNTKPDYIKNRPFYTGEPVETVLLPETTITIGNSDNLISSSFPYSFEVGQTYVITFDGVDTEYTAYEFQGFVFVGYDYSSVSGGSGYVVIANNGSIVLTTMDQSLYGSHTIAIKIYTQEIVKIDEKYLPIATTDTLGISKISIQSIDPKKNYTTSEIQTICDNIMSGSVIYRLLNNYIASCGGTITDTGNANFKYVNGLWFEITPTEGVWNFSSANVHYESEVVLENNTKNLILGLTYGDINSMDNLPALKCQFNTKGFVGKYIDVDSAILLTIPDRSKKYWISASKDEKLCVKKCSIGSTDAITETTLFQNGEDYLILSSSNPDSTKQFKITVDDDYNVSATNTSDSVSKTLATTEYVDNSVSNPLNITSATVGQIAKISAVDDTGKPTTWETINIPTPFKPEGKSYLTFSSPNSFTLAVNDTTKHWDGTLEYFASNKTWTAWDGTTTLSSVDNDGDNVLYLRGTGNTVITGNGYTYFWVLTGSNISCIGNIENLLDYATVTAGNHPTMADYCYYTMFFNCISLVQAPDLPATTLANYCYYAMFSGCTSLTQAPAIPATTLANDCYSNMFNSCTSLIQAPALPATTLADYCYDAMFLGCASLTHAPALPVTTLANDCYRDMFKDCTSLIQAPALPATTLTDRCYWGMFQGCTSLIQAPVLRATTLTERCYWSMFYDCTSLTQAPALPATTLANECYASMFRNCTSLTQAPALPATTLAEKCYYAMFLGCASLTHVPVLPAITLAIECYGGMFKNCTSIKLSSTNTGEYTQEYRIPSSGTGTTATYALSDMFTNTGGNFMGAPEINTTYYLSSDNMIVRDTEIATLNGYVGSMIDVAIGNAIGGSY